MNSGIDAVDRFCASSWKKLGLIYKAEDFVQTWAKNSALTPTPLLRKSGEIRVFAGFRDDAGVSRIGYVDIDPDSPEKIIAVSMNPVLDVGRDGCFDDNGVILGDVIRVGQRIYMFYVGFQLVAKVKFLAVTGLAISDDDGDSFSRVSESPLLDRHQSANYIAAIHTAMHVNGRWKLWYAAGDSWQEIGGGRFPCYEIRFVETGNLLDLPCSSAPCLAPEGNEYRIGRPRVYLYGSGYLMHYTAGTLAGDYTPGVAYSADGVNWVRGRNDFPLTLSSEGWDSRHLSYPVMLRVKDRVLAFYNGNDMGRDGFGIAECRDSTVLSMLK